MVPTFAKQEQWCKCGADRCGKGFCMHGIKKYSCKREGCRGSQVCEHNRSKYDCTEGNCTGSSRCKHGSLRPSRCAKCLSEPKAPRRRQAAKKFKDCEVCEGECQCAVGRGYCRRVYSPGRGWRDRDAYDELD